MINLTEMFLRATEKDITDHAEKEVLKKGQLRVGTSGILSPEGGVAGKCVRQAHLRQLGYEVSPPEENTRLMFDLGYANEDIIYNKLVHQLPAGHVIRREEEIPVSWSTKNGTTVSGRPDMVICSSREDGGVSPVLGIELKSVHSVWTARGVLFGLTPKLGHLIQAAHYMWRMGIPWKLIYTSYSQLGQGMSWAKQMAGMFPKQGEPLSEFLEYNKKGIPKHVKQFQVIYDLQFDASGRLSYRLEGDEGGWTPTIISTQGIESFQEYVSNMSSEKKLGERPTSVNAHGDKENFSECDYCPLQIICDSHESRGYDEWVQECIKFLRESADINKTPAGT